MTSNMLEKAKEAAEKEKATQKEAELVKVADAGEAQGCANWGPAALLRCMGCKGQGEDPGR